MEKQELERMNDYDLVKYIDEQKKLGRKGLTQRQIAEILEVNENTFKTRMQKARKKGELTSTMSEQSSTLEEIEEPAKIQKEQKRTANKQRVQTSTNKNNDFTEKEIKVLKEILQERESNIELFHEYRIYKELEKVPTGADYVRSAFNMSKETTERLKKFSNVRRIPLQDLVELAVINMLEQYDKGK